MGIEDEEFNGGQMESTLLMKRRCCFCIPCMGPSNRSGSAGSMWWQRVPSSSAAADRDGGNRWWMRGLMALKKLREWSEIVAGPKWKTFIRRFNRNRCVCGGRGSGKEGKFRYDAYSYALNFDDAAVENGGSEKDYRNFSSRYAAIPISVSARAPIDLAS